jgi:signal transduction histidine kinase
MNQSRPQPHNVDGIGLCSGDAFLTPDRTHRRFRPLAFARLEQAFSALGDELIVTDRVGFRIFVSGRPQALDSCMQEQIYLIAEEAIRNALRHSEATSVEVEIEYVPNKLRVVVRDNGCGINGEALLRDWHGGLLTMRERAAGIAAKLRVWSRQGAGTEVEIRVPTHVAQAFLV